MPENTTDTAPVDVNTAVGEALADEAAIAVPQGQAAALKALRTPMPARLISKKPVNVPKNGDKRSCNECGGYHVPCSQHLDYAGHAAITERLLEVDPLWSWRPVTDPALLAVLPRMDGGMWIELTVAGVTRLGYGDAQGKGGHNAVKEIIGDALRNAAMRFGVGLELWHKGQLHEDTQAAEREAAEQARRDAAEAEALATAQAFADTASTVDLEDSNAVDTLAAINTEAREARVLGVTVKVGDKAGPLGGYLQMLGSRAVGHAAARADADVTTPEGGASE
ncbi:MAG TPA: hypothetical protein VIQ30_22735 [Pseudonocardia sp.]